MLFKKNKFILLLIIGLCLQCFSFYIPCVSSTSWYNSSWLYSTKIVIDHTKVNQTLTNFPVLIDNTSSSFAHAQGDGDDFVFVNSDNTTKYNHEIEYFSSNRLISWVNVTSLSSSVDTVIYMYYGNSGCSNQQNIEGTWNSNFKMVQHMDDLTTSSIEDSTINSYDGTKTGANTPIVSTSGMIGSCQYNDGSSKCITTGKHYQEMGITKDFTISGIVKTTTHTITRYWSGGATAGGSNREETYFASNIWGGIVIAKGNGNPTGGAVSDNVWVFYTMTYDGANTRLYIDTNAVITSTVGSGNLVTTSDFTMFRPGEYNGGYWNGYIDEVRLSNIAHNSSWISTCYNNQNSPSSFCSIGTEKSCPPNPPVYFEARSINSTFIQLNWTKGTGAYKTVVIARTNITTGYLSMLTWIDNAYPVLGIDAVLYNGTGSWFNHTGLIEDSHWFYRVYSYNTSGGFSTTNLRSHDTTLGLLLGSIKMNVINASCNYSREYNDSTIETYQENMNQVGAHKDNMIDNDWNTYDSIGADDTFEGIYYKPVGSVGAIWNIKTTEGNLSLLFSDADWNLHLNFISVLIYSGGTYLEYYLNSGVDYYNGSTNDNVYEDRITWLYEGWNLNITSIGGPFYIPVFEGNSWKMVSIPLNYNVDKYDVRVVNATNNYTFNQAVSLNIIDQYVFGWQVSPAGYILTDTFEPYQGYFTWFYNDDYNYWVNTSSGGCYGIVWINYTDVNLTFNVSYNKATNANTSSYKIYAVQSVMFITGNNLAYTSTMGASLPLVLGLFFKHRKKKKKIVFDLKE